MKIVITLAFLGILTYAALEAGFVHYVGSLIAPINHTLATFLG